MLGESIEDPDGEEEGGSLHGMGLLPVRTVFEKEKVQTRVTGEILQNPGAGDGLFAALCGSVFSGYEIHMGETKFVGDAGVLTRIEDTIQGKAKADGAWKGNVYGTYVHGIFDREDVAKKVAEDIGKKKGLDMSQIKGMDFAAFKETQYDLLAEGLRKHLDMKKIYEILEAGIETSK